ncbi:hypothetical protein [Paraburkholderia humisilvae]|uniref:hypothetical protein n=1 Tax=Paraburkholderia humisilvae TaxID=627669 RepID=UPI001581E4C4|nr:hypothetical protein [Paraburkholderia humisilvae]
MDDVVAIDRMVDLMLFRICFNIEPCGLVARGDGVAEIHAKLVSQFVVRPQTGVQVMSGRAA